MSDTATQIDPGTRRDPTTQRDPTSQIDSSTRMDTPARIDTTASIDTTTRIDAGLAALRVMVGTVFAAHGAQKLFVFGLAGVGEAFASMGVPLAAVVALALAGPGAFSLDALLRRRQADA